MRTPTERLTKSDFEQLAEFRYGLRQFLRFAENTAQEHGLTSLQYLLLLNLKGYPGRSWALVGELSERLQSVPHAVVALVSRCEAAGLVERRRGTADRRQVQVHLTAKGERAVRSVASRNRVEAARLGDLLRRTVAARPAALRSGRSA